MTEEIPNANAFHLDEEPPIVQIPEFPTVRTQTIEERRGQPLLVWAILGAGAIIFGSLIALLWHDKDQMQASLNIQTETSNKAITLASKAFETSENIEKAKAETDSKLDRVLREHKAMMSALETTDHKVDSQGRKAALQDRKLGELERRITQSAPATITGTINAPAAIQKPIPPALGHHPGESAIAPAMDELGLERVYRSNAAEDSWRVLTSDNRRVEVRPVGSSSDGTIYVKDVVSGAAYFIDGKTRVAYASRK